MRAMQIDISLGCRGADVYLRETTLTRYDLCHSLDRKTGIQFFH
jgi:hypothetical protein